MTDKLPLAPSGVFRTIQGEGALLGVPMVFVRLAGCSVGCKQCDTDYSVAERLEPRDIAYRVADLLATDGVCEWVWITGGEPTDHNLLPLMAELRRTSPFIKLALATSGHKAISQVFAAERWDWLSVSPHDTTKWVQKFGSELKIVPGLNGLKLADVEVRLGELMSFQHRYIQPLEGDADSLHQCLEWVQRKRGWRLTIQAHKGWQIP